MNKWIVVCGTMMVFIYMMVRGIRYNLWRPDLNSMIEVFLSGAMLPVGVIFFSFSLLEKPSIDIIMEHSWTFAIAGISLLYCGISRIIKEIRE